MRYAAAPPHGPTGSGAAGELGHGTVPERSHERSVVSSSIPAESTSSGASCCSSTPATEPTCVVGERLEQRSRKSGLADDVVVDEDDDRVSDRLDAAVDGASEPDVLVDADDPYVGKRCGDHLGRAVGRSVVDDDDVVRDRLALQTAESASRSSARALQRRDDDCRPHRPARYANLGVRAGRAPDLLARPEAGGRVVRGGLLRGVGYGVGTLLAAGTAVLLLRHLGRDDFGRYGTVAALLGIVSGISDAGLTAVGSRELALAPVADRPRLLRNLVTLRLVDHPHRDRRRRRSSPPSPTTRRWSGARCSAGSACCS